MKNIAIYPGTFDPITLGHLDIIERAAKLYDQVIVAVAISARKSPVFALEQREKMIKLATQKFKNVVVSSFDGLSVEFARKNNAKVILRGIRAVSDFDYELQLMGMNRQLAPEIETVFLAPAEHYSFISATIVREIINVNGDISAFVPKEIVAVLTKIK